MMMKQFLVLMMMATICVGDELGERVLWNALAPGVKWDTAPGVTVTGEGVFHCAGDYGWATTGDLLPYSDATKVDLQTHGPVKVQAEWFREDGTFMSATQFNAGKLDVPAGERPRKFRFKFWLEGKGTEAKLSRALVTVSKVWRKAGTKLVKTYDAKSKTTPDEGMKLDGLDMKLEKEYSAFVFDDKVAFDAKGTLLVDVAGLKNGAVTVQALCWSADDAFQKAVDLVKDMSAAGYTEAPVAMHKEDFPADVAKLSFKVWLSGKEATARLGALHYGVLP